jgi:hypothetical protein
MLVDYGRSVDEAGPVVFVVSVLSYSATKLSGRLGNLLPREYLVWGIDEHLVKGPADKQRPVHDYAMPGM